jgi:S-adenosylmethionine:tRNA ribosyltransferase-isomerase
MFNTQLTIDELDYVLPHELIAQTPASERGGSRLLVTGAGEFEPRLIGRFDEVVLDQLQADDLVIANDSRVMRARVPITRDTGGGGELLLLESVASMATDTTSIWRAMARPARKLRPGSTVVTTLGGASIRCIARESAQLWLVELPAAVDDVPTWLQAHGELPLPPYITKRQADDERYQTVHAAHEACTLTTRCGIEYARGVKLHTSPCTLAPEPFCRSRVSTSPSTSCTMSDLRSLPMSMLESVPRYAMGGASSLLARQRHAR